MSPRLARWESRGVTLLGDPARPGGVAFAFTERGGGVSLPPYDSLNLGTNTGDDPAAVAENRARALAALGVDAASAARLVSPRQVHGTRCLVVDDASPAALAHVAAEAEAGADAVCCSVPGVPVMLCFADCLPVVLVAPGAFAVAHSGWRGTLGRVSAVALAELLAASGARADEVSAYVGPHVSGGDYEVSEELLARFEGEFGSMVRVAGSRLDLARAVRATLEGEGVPADRIVECDASTVSCTDRFFSYRAEGGPCGRLAAIAWMDPAGARGRTADVDGGEPDGVA